MMPVTQMNTHLMCPKCCPTVLGVPFLSMFNSALFKSCREHYMHVYIDCKYMSNILNCPMF